MTSGRASVLVALVAGALIRAAALPLPGAGDVDPWKVWSYHAMFLAAWNIGDPRRAFRLKRVMAAALGGLVVSVLGAECRSSRA